MSVDEWKTLHNMFVKTQDSVQLSGHYQGMRAEFSLRALTRGYAYDSRLAKTKSGTHRKSPFLKFQEPRPLNFSVTKKNVPRGK